jgi:hypothetical protein
MPSFVTILPFSANAHMMQYVCTPEGQDSLLPKVKSILSNVPSLS